MTLVTAGSGIALGGSTSADERLLAGLIRLTTAALSVPAVVQILDLEAIAEAAKGDTAARELANFCEAQLSVQHPDDVFGTAEGQTPTHRVCLPIGGGVSGRVGVLHAVTATDNVLSVADLSLLLETADTAAAHWSLRAEPLDTSDELDPVVAATDHFPVGFTLDSLDVGVLACDLQGKVLMANDAAYRIAGSRDESAAEISGRTQLLVPDTHAPLPEEEWPLRRAIRDKAVNQQVICVSHADGRLTYHRSTARPLLDPAGEVFGAAVVFTDVTDFHDRSAQLKAARDHAQQIIAAAGDAFLSFGPDGLLREWNEAAERLLGWTDGAPPATSIATVLDDVNAYRQALSSGATLETVVRGRGERMVDVELVGWITTVDGEQHDHVFLRDISARKATELAQARVHRDLTEALDAMPRSVTLAKVVRDSEGKPDHLVVQWCNQHLLDLIEKRPSEVEGRQMGEVFPRVTAAGLESRILDATRTDTPLHELIEDYAGEHMTGCFEMLVTPMSQDRLLIENTDVTQQRAAERKVERSERMLAAAYRASGMGSFEYEVGRDAAIWSPELFKIHDLDPESPTPSRDDIRARIHPEDLDGFDGRAQQFAAGLTHSTSEFRIVRPDGTIRHLAEWTQAMFDKHGKVNRVTGAVQDQTERRERELALVQSRELERLVVDLSPIGIALMDETGTYVQVNNAFCTMQGRTRDDLLQTNFLDMIHPDDRGAADLRHRQIIRNKVSGTSHDLRYLHANGRAFWVSIHKTPLNGGDPSQPMRILTQVIDISERQRRADELTRQARTDALTGLANRRSWEPRLSSALTAAKTEGWPLAVAIMDLDKFKNFNDTYGHPVGDELLAETSAAWRAYLIRHAPRALLARLGGEEFGVLMPKCDEITARKLLEGMSAVVERGQTASAGYTVATLDDDTHTLMTRADIALYAAKNAGRARVEYKAGEDYASKAS